jgi:hypothetical protein
MSQLKFFGGDPSAKSKFKFVSPLQCSTFQGFFETQLWAPVRLALTEAQYRALPKDEQKLAKWVRYFTPGAFRECESGNLYPKNNENVESISLICIDIDTATEAQPIFENPKLLWEMLDGFNFVVYTTLNHRPEAPRLRVIVEASGFEPALYAEASNFIAGKIGLPTLNKESQIPSQAMFRPTVFADSDGNPVLLHNLKGSPLAPEHFQGQTTLLPKALQTKAKEGNILEGLEFLQPIIEGITLGDAAEALNHVSPNCSMHDWIRCAMALRHQFPDQDDEAFQVYDSWSSGGATYEGTEKTRYRWEHTSPNTFTRLPTTIKTLFKLAKDAGWDASEKEEDRFQYLKSWIHAQGRIGELVEPGLQKIAASPLLTSVYEEALIAELVKAAKKLGFNATISKMGKRLRALKALIRDRQYKQEEAERGTPDWVKGLIYISKLEVFYRYQTGEQVSRSSFDSTYAKMLLPSERELEERGDTSRQAKNTPTIRPQDFVLNELQIPCVYDDCYDPLNPDDHISTKGGVRFANTYRRSYATPKPGLAKEHGQILKNHVALLIAEPEYQRQLLDFIAFMVQHPGRKIRWAFLIQSAQGNGKGLIAKALRGVLGRGNIKTVDPEAIFSQWNDWAYGTQLTIMNEIRLTGHSRHDVMNKLKEPIADDHVSVNQRFRDNREVENFTNYLMFTNHRDALALEQRERRYFVVFSPLQTDKDIEALNQSEKLQPLQDLVDGGEFGGVRAFFEEWEISSDFCPNSPPPKTAYFAEMAKVTKSEMETVFDEIIAEGDNPMIKGDLLSASSLLAMLNTELPKSVSAKALNQLLSSKNFNYVGRQTIMGERHQIWVNRNADFFPFDNDDFEAIFKERIRVAEQLEEAKDLL